MTSITYALLGTVTLGVVLAGSGAPRHDEPQAASILSGTERRSSSPHDAQIQVYCVGCHNERLQSGGVTLARFEIETAEQHAELAERVIHKLRAGMMPPAGAKRPDAAEIQSIVASLEARLDQAATLHPNPGRRTFQRLNRAEYARSVHDLLDLDIDVDALLPPDTISHNFDNIADVQTLSPTLMESYLRAARQVSIDAVGDPNLTPRETTYKVPRTASQMVHVDGAPLGTRGGLSVVHNFPADGEYRFKMMLHGTEGGVVWGSTAKDEQIDLSVNGERIALLKVDPTMTEADPDGLTLQTPPIRIKAGPRRLSAVFVRQADGPVDDLMSPIQHTLADQQIGDAYGITVLPHLRDLSVSGPYNVTGVSATPSSRKIFTCHPASRTDETRCAREIVLRIANAAYRGPAPAPMVDRLMTFYAVERKAHDFRSGIRTAIEAILASPRFVFRLEQEPAGAAADQNYRVTDLALASRLAYFLWATIPDTELMTIAGRGRLHEPAVIEQQARRMLLDRRAAALSARDRAAPRSTR